MLYILYNIFVLVFGNMFIHSVFSFHLRNISTLFFGTSFPHPPTISLPCWKKNKTKFYDNKFRWHFEYQDINLPSHLHKNQTLNLSFTRTLMLVNVKSNKQIVVNFWSVTFISQVSHKTFYRVWCHRFSSECECTYLCQIPTFVWNVFSFWSRIQTAFQMKINLTIRTLCFYT